MHPWADTFRRAAASLSSKERAVLEAPASARPSWAPKAEILSSDANGMGELFSVPASPSGAFVTPETAMRLSAVYRGTALLAGAIASLPLPVYRREDDGSRKAEVDSALWWLLNEQPTPRFSAATFWEFIGASMLLRGDGFAVLVRNRALEVTEIIPVPSSCVTVTRDGNRLVYAMDDVFEAGRLAFDQDDVLHFPGFGFDGLRSMSVVAWGAWLSIGTALSTEEYAGRFFANGATPRYYITRPGDLDEKQLDELRDAWARRYGGAQNSHKPLMLWGGMEAKSLSLNAEDSQLIESRRFQIEDIARAFGVPPFMLGATDKTTSWGSGVEHMGQGFLTYTLMPHLNRFQQEINRKVFRISRYFVEFNVSGLLQADSQGQAKYYREALGGSQGPGWMKVNEIRKLQNLPPVVGGDTLYEPKGTANEKGPEAPAAAAE